MQYSMFHKTKTEEVVRETLSVRRRGTCREEDTCPERCKGELREEMQREEAEKTLLKMKKRQEEFQHNLDSAA